MTTLREKCPNTVFFLDQIQENTDQKNPLFGHCSRSVKYKIFAIMIIKQFIKRLIAISPQNNKLLQAIVLSTNTKLHHTRVNSMGIFAKNMCSRVVPKILSQGIFQA